MDQGHREAMAALGRPLEEAPAPRSAPPPPARPQHRLDLVLTLFALLCGALLAVVIADEALPLNAWVVATPLALALVVARLAGRSTAAALVAGIAGSMLAGFGAAVLIVLRVAAGMW